MTDGISINTRLVPWVVNDALSHLLSIVQRAQESCEGETEFLKLGRLRVKIMELQNSQEFAEVTSIGLRP